MVEKKFLDYGIKCGAAWTKKMWRRVEGGTLEKTKSGRADLLKSGTSVSGDVVAQVNA
jgi:hypothetical protein